MYHITSVNAVIFNKIVASLKKINTKILWHYSFPVKLAGWTWFPLHPFTPSYLVSHQQQLYKHQCQVATALKVIPVILFRNFHRITDLYDSLVKPHTSSRYPHHLAHLQKGGLSRWAIALQSGSSPASHLNKMIPQQSGGHKTSLILLFISSFMFHLLVCTTCYCHTLVFVQLNKSYFLECKYTWLEGTW